MCGLEQSHGFVHPPVPRGELRQPAVRVGETRVEFHRPASLALGRYHLVLAEHQSGEHRMGLCEGIVLPERPVQFFAGSLGRLEEGDRSF